MKTNLIYTNSIHIKLFYLFMTLCVLIPKVSQSQTSTEPRTIVTNENFINGLYKPDLADDRLSIFRYVFSQLKDEVMVYPTENYYYFDFTLGGRRIKGNLGFLAHGGNDKLITFSYEEKFIVPDINNEPRIRELFLTSVDSVYLERINDFKYTLRFEGKTVTFKLNDIGMNPPKKEIVTSDETYVAPSFDESGIQFYLLYNKKWNTLFWILNEDNFVPESFMSYTDELLIGRRTEFAFFNDTANRRKILVAVRAENVADNNWFDGPFDQLPDNYIRSGAVDLQKYIELCYPEEKGKIDKFGIYLADPDIRVSISPYITYSSKDQIVKWIDALKASSNSTPEFYSKLTKTRR